MKRRHTRAQAVALCAELRRRRPDVVLGADLIAGFPTETEDQFQRTLGMIGDCDLTHLHVFPYSARPGTPAARMPPVAPSVIKQRAARLREHGVKALAVHLAAQVGRTDEVLMERGGVGRLADFTAVTLQHGAPGSFAMAKITGHDGQRLQGVLA